MNAPAPTLPTETEIDASAVASASLDTLATALEREDAAAVAALFDDRGWWRDQLAASWTISTFHGPDEIGPAWERHLAGTGFRNVTLVPETAMLVPDAIDEPWVQASFGFETAVATGQGVVRLVPRDGGWKIWTLLTTMTGLTGHEERRTSWAEASDPDFSLAQPGRDRMAEKRRKAAAFTDGEPAVVVVGAGHAGLGVAARLQRLGIETLIVERNPRVGDNWRERYDNLLLHDPSWIQHLPYLPFAETWPLIVDKDKLGDWLESYANALDLNVWTGTEVEDATYDDATGEWAVRVRRDGTERTLQPRHVVYAPGLQGIPHVPELSGQDIFGGTVVHSMAFKDGRPFAGRKAVVVGAGSSAHDIALELYEQGAEVTMVQRSPTYVMSGDRALPHLQGGVEGLPTDVLDLMLASFPWTEAARRDQIQAAELAEIDRELLEGLEAAGFRTTRTGMITQGLMPEAGGYYIDQGCSQLIVDRKVRVVAGGVVGFDAEHVLLDDGTAVEADLVVLATGFKNMRESVRGVFGDEVAERVGDVWGIDPARREIKAIWADSGQPGLWITGGALFMSRHYSRLLALQIKGVEIGLHVQPSALTTAG